MTTERWRIVIGGALLLLAGCVTDGQSGDGAAQHEQASASVSVKAADEAMAHHPAMAEAGGASHPGRVWKTLPLMEPLPSLPPQKNPNDAPYDAMYFTHYGVNPTLDTDEEPVSTFAVDVDTASYAMARSYLERGHLPPREAIRVEEFVNAFDYHDAPPSTGDFALTSSLFPSLSRKGYHLLRIAIKGREVDEADRLPSNLVFVVDTSGSMSRENRLGLVKKGLGYLVDRLRDDDTVAIVTYGTNASLILRPTSGREKSTILASLMGLTPSGSTNAQAGIHLGYETAAKVFRKGAINRIVLCSDGVANNGIATGAEGIFATVKEKAAKGITLSAIGFGMGNYNDTLMERLADNGDGNYAYVDRPAEARRVFAENLTGMLQVIARDVKVQVAFDPKRVSRYRLLGYENRRLENRQFADDTVDAGEIGAGHAVTALYEVKLNGTDGPVGEFRLRHKRPEGKKSTLTTFPLPSQSVKGAAVSERDILASVVALFAERLRGSYWTRDVGYDGALAQLARIKKATPQVTELGDLLRRAKGLDTGADRFGAPRSENEDEVPPLH